MSEINNGASFLDDLLNGATEVPQEEKPSEDATPQDSAAEPVPMDSGVAEPVPMDPSPTSGSDANDAQKVVRPNSDVGIAIDLDIILAIDCSGSMDLMINRIKDFALSFNDKLKAALEGKKRMPRKIRMKILGFRDFYFDIEPNPPIQQTDFLTVYGNEDPATDGQELQTIRDFVASLEPRGGEDEPESGLEALHLAFTSEWSNDPNVTKRRHIVVLFTDTEPHALDDPRRDDPEQNPGNNYPMDCPRDMAGLFSEYCAMESVTDSTSGRRLFLYAPKGGVWEELAGSWDNVQLEEPVESKQCVAGTNKPMYDFESTALFIFLAGSI